MIKQWFKLFKIRVMYTIFKEEVYEAICIALMAENLYKTGGTPEYSPINLSNFYNNSNIKN
jgi:hypothetical protein